MTEAPPATREAVLVALVARSLVPPHATAETISGGVSCDVYRVSFDSQALVVKVGRPRLRTDTPWEADPGRVLREARAMSFVHGRLGPVAVPEPPFVLPDLLLFATEFIPSQRQSWRASLLQGEVDATIGPALGEALARLHTMPVTEQWQDDVGLELLADLRLQPFYVEVAERLPECRRRLLDLAEFMEAGGDAPAFVHGDVSPKNVLIGVDGSVNLIDWEVFHVGDVSFDLGMLSAHFLCKAVALQSTEARTRLADLLSGVWGGYLVAGGPAPEQRVVRQAGAVALARVHGRSRSDYLRTAELQQSVTAAAQVLLNSGESVEEVVDLIGSGGTR